MSKLGANGKWIVVSQSTFSTTWGSKDGATFFGLCIEETKNSSMKEEKKKDWMVGNSYMSLICTPIC